MRQVAKDKTRIVTLLDVAVKAGVSSMTVSKVLRGVGNISEETRQRVRCAADELGYLPNNLAGSLSSRKSRMVAVIIPSMSDIVFSEVLSGVNAILRPNGLHTFIGESHFDPGIEADLVREMLSFRPAGLLLNGGMARSAACDKLLERRTCPAIQLWDCDNEDLDFSAGPSHDAGRATRCCAFPGAPPEARCLYRRRIGEGSLRPLPLPCLAVVRLRAANIDVISMVCEHRPRQAETGRALTQELIRDASRDPGYSLSERRDGAWWPLLSARSGNSSSRADVRGGI